MTPASTDTSTRNPLEICIDDAVAHGGVVMAEVVARARKSLYEVARLGRSPDEAAAASQARQLLGDKAGFFEDEFPAALRSAMLQPGPIIAVGFDAELKLAVQALAEPLAEFAAAASEAYGSASAVPPDSNPLTPDVVIQAMQTLLGQIRVSGAVGALCMQHLCLALGPELAAEYRRLSELMRSLLQRLALQASASAARTSHASTAQMIAADISVWPEIQNVPDIVRNFVLGPWSEVIAHAETAAGNPQGSAPIDPDGYLALVRPLFWSAQPTLGRSDMQRLLITVPSLLSRLRSGLQSIGYPADRAAEFFRALDDLHGIAARAAGSSFATRREPRNLGSAQDGPMPEPLQATAVPSDENRSRPTARVSPAAASQILVPGVMLAAWEGGRWVRWELIWVSPKGKLLLFKTEDGDADSMSRAGCIRRIVEQRMHVLPDISF